MNGVGKRIRECLLAGVFAITAGAGAAEEFPAHPVRMIVPASPGGTTDFSARLIATELGRQLGQSVVVENMPGAGTLIGIQAVKKAAPDGYTLLLTSNTIAALPSTRLNPGFDLSKDFAAVGTVARSPWVVVEAASQPDNSLADLVARAKTENLSFASSGIGATPHLAAASFLHEAGVDMMHVPYGGNGAAMADVMAGRITMIFDGVATSAPKIRGGQLRALAVTSAERLPDFPDIPTAIEQGYPGFTSYVYFGVLAPAGTPDNVIEKLSQALRSTLRSPELSERLQQDSLEPVITSPKEFDEYLVEEAGRMATLISALGISKE